MWRYLLSCVSFLYAAFSAAADNVPQVVVTIKPIHALVSDIMEGVAKPTLLLNKSQSPHTYHSRPSDIKQLQTADLLVWVGPNVESFLPRILSSLPKKTLVLELNGLPQLTLLSARRGGIWEAHHHQDAHNKHDHAKHENAFDQHIWLSPSNAKVIVQAITNTLAQINPDNAHYYRGNADHVLKQLEQLDEHLRQELASIKGEPFLVFHDAYQYFERDYGLNAIGSISVSPENRPSVKRISELRERIRSQKIRCVFSEPQFESALVSTIIENTSAKSGVLDPLGTSLPAEKHPYFTLLHHLAKALKECLS